MSSIIPKELGTPKQWFGSLINPSEWTSTEPYFKRFAVAAKAAGEATAKQNAELEAKKASDKIAADEAAAKEAAEKAAAALALRRRASKKYYTVGGAQGLLSEAPVLLKTLLGQ